MVCKDPRFWGFVEKAVISAESAKLDCHWNRLSKDDVIVKPKLDSADVEIAIIKAKKTCLTS
jgi:hypothetical protein